MAEKLLSVDAFRARLMEQVKSICKDHGGNYDKEKDRGVAFQHWAGRLVAQHEGVEFDDQNVFGSNDLKVDVVIEDIDQKSLYLIQTKFVSPTQNPLLDESEVSDFFTRHALLKDGSWVKKHASDQLFELVGDYSHYLDTGWSIHFYFVSTGRASDRVKALVDELEQKVKGEEQGVSYYLLDWPALKEYLVEAQTIEQQIPEAVEFDLPGGHFFYRKSPRPTIVAQVKANTLVNLYRKHRESLFSYNIRSFLGRKGLNKQIVETAENDSEDFFYFNNGVSAICTKIELNEKTGHFRGENFQVINGAQTIGSLKAVKGLSGSVEVLLRITEGESVKTEKGFNADVIRYNNTQNIIKSSDFRANDPIQLWIEHYMQGLRPRGAIEKRLYYLRKRSFRRPQGVQVVRFEDLAKIRFTWFYEPTRAVADPKSLWAFEADGGVYEQAFGVDGELGDFWPDDVAHETVFTIVAYLMIEDIIAGLIKRDRTRFIFLRRLRFFALALFRAYLQEKQIDRKNLMQSRSEFEREVRKFWEHAVKELVSVHHDAISKDKTTVFALARSTTRWEETRDKFKTFLAAI